MGIRARGDATVSLEWDACGVQSIEIISGHDGPLTLRSSLFSKDFRAGSGMVMKVGLEPATKDGRHTFTASRGVTYGFWRADRTCTAN